MDQETLVAESMAETIIPKTTTPGAKDLNLDQFVWLMLDDCSKKADQQAFFKGMDEFNDLTKKTYSKRFSECTKDQKLALLNTFEKKPEQKNPNPGPDAKYSKELHAFFGTVKGLTVFGYTESRNIL